jgi:hypothetical protein
VPRFLAVLAVLCVCVPAVALAAADTDPKKKLNAADQAKARSVLLKRTDFAAGWKKVPSSTDSDEACPGFNPNNSDLTLTGEGRSEFEHAQSLVSVGSYSEVYVTKADATASWTRNVKPALIRCLGHFLRVGVEEEGGSFRAVSQGRIAFPKFAPRTAAFRLVARVTVRPPNEEPVTAPFTIQVVALGHGRGDVALVGIGFGNGIPIADLRAFAKLSAARLAAAKL